MVINSYFKSKLFLKNFIFGKNLNLNKLDKFLNNNKIIVCDIGSTGGLSSNWLGIHKLIEVYAFDPDRRAKSSDQFGNKIGNVTTFNIGLWSSKQNKDFYLTNYPDASSLYEPNNDILKKFLNSECSKVISTTKIKVDKLDNVIRNYESANFLKIDAEGADYQILKGSINNLRKSVLALQIEVQFVERNKSTPNFSKINNFLINNEFLLMDLDSEHWIQSNRYWNINAKPQIIWADAVYVISPSSFFLRFSKKTKKEKLCLLAKLIIISLNYFLYDYAIELIDYLRKNKFINKIEYRIFKITISMNIQNNFICILKQFVFLIIFGFISLLLLPIPKVNKIFLNYFKRLIFIFFQSLSKIFGRKGPNNVAI